MGPTASLRLPFMKPSKTQNKWIDGAMQSTMDQNCYTGLLAPITSEFVSYWGNEAATSPKVGDVYYGRVVVAGVGRPCAGPMASIEVILPANTFFAIDETNPVHCFTATIEEWKFKELPRKDCPQKTYKGYYGWVFNRPGGEPWDVRNGKLISVAFPLVSTKVMKGIATNDYLTGAVRALSGQYDPWDDPEVGVFVADNPPTVTYDKKAATEITATSARTTATINNHYKGGRVVFELGTTTKYEIAGEVVNIDDKANAYTVYQDWTGLKPNTTYHWRAKFITANARSYTGKDQTFTTKSK